MSKNLMGAEEAMAEKQQAQVVNTIAPAKMTLAEVRAQLEGKTGKRFWQNLDSLADSPQFVQAPFTATIQAQNATNGIVTDFTGTVSLTSTLGIPVQPSVSGAFVQGSWTGSIMVAQPATNLVLEADDGLGDSGVANAINIFNSPVLGEERDGNFLLLYWPASVPGFVIETAPRLNSSNWVPVNSAPFQLGNTNLEIFKINGSTMFYRLLYSVP